MPDLSRPRLDRRAAEDARARAVTPRILVPNHPNAGQFVKLRCLGCGSRSVFVEQEPRSRAFIVCLLCGRRTDPPA